MCGHHIGHRLFPSLQKILVDSTNLKELGDGNQECFYLLKDIGYFRVGNVEQGNRGNHIAERIKV